MVKLRVAEIARQKGFRISRVKEQTGLCWDVTNRYWHGSTPNISLDILEKIARVLEVRVIDLIHEGVEDGCGGRNNDSQSV